MKEILLVNLAWEVFEITHISQSVSKQIETEFTRHNLCFKSLRNITIV